MSVAQGGITVDKKNLKVRKKIILKNIKKTAYLEWMQIIEPEGDLGKRE